MLRIFTLTCALLILAGCATRRTILRETRDAYIAGRQDAAAQAAQAAKTQTPAVTVRGNVTNPVIPWSEDLTLARAIIEADDQSLTNPRKIFLTRGNRTIEILPRQLLNGFDIPLEAGDIVTITH